MGSLYLQFNGLGNNLNKWILFKGSKKYAYWAFNVFVFAIGIWTVNEGKLMKYILPALNTDRKTLFSKLQYAQRWSVVDNVKIYLAFTMKMAVI